MQNSQLPAKWYKPFAADDSAKVEIPLTTPDPTRASQSLGFPPLTMQPPESGGVPPQGEDFNGAMNQVARIAWWLMAGGAMPFDNTWATNGAIGGYPQGGAIASADLQGEWISTADNNTNNPDTVGTGWVPGYSYGLSLIGTVGVNLAASVTLTPAQAAKGIIFVQGNLAAATTIIFPAWAKHWLVVNNTGSGAFSLTVKTAAGVGVVVNRGDVVPILCDGTNMLVAQQAASAHITRIAATSSFTVPAGVTTIYVSGCAAGAGGGGGGGATNALGTGAGGGGGGAGQAIIRQPFTVTPGTNIAITIPTGGTGGSVGTPTLPGGTGSAGGDTIIGSLVTLSGAAATTGGVNFTSTVPAGGGSGTGFPNGSSGNDGIVGANGGVGNGGAGASGPFGGGGGGGRAGSTGISGAIAAGYGGGGGGGGGGYGSTSGGANGGAGGNGGPGLVIIEW